MENWHNFLKTFLSLAALMKNSEWSNEILFKILLDQIFISQRNEAEIISTLKASRYACGNLNKFFIRFIHFLFDSIIAA